MKISRKFELTLWLVAFIGMLGFFGFQHKNITGGLLVEDDFERVQGKVISSKLSFTSGGRTASGYYVDIEYSYIVNDREYVSDKYSFGSSFFNNLEEAEQISGKYRRGDELTIYVSKSNPNLSALKYEENSNYKLAVTLVILLFVFTIVMFDIRKRWKKEDKKRSHKNKRSYP
jgi:hypothetical protein